jgi:hypothetical protein
MAIVRLTAYGPCPMAMGGAQGIPYTTLQPVTGCNSRRAHPCARRASDGAFEGHRAMNRHERRAAKARKWEVGTVVRTQNLIIDTGEGPRYYWFECPENFSLAQAEQFCSQLEDGEPINVQLHGPFMTEAEADEDSRLTLFGPQMKITEGGEWNPAWDRMQ